MICRNFVLRQVLEVVVPGGTLLYKLPCVMENFDLAGVLQNYFVAWFGLLAACSWSMVWGGGGVIRGKG